jgi:hypothetical protein
MRSGRIEAQGGIRYRGDATYQLTGTKTELFGPYPSSTIPLSNQAATLDEWLPWILNRIKTITGETDWFTNPNASLLSLQTSGGAGTPNALVRTNNLSDLTSLVQARTNLGLGSAATQPSSAFATSAHIHAASTITSIATTNISATNVQSAIEDLDVYITNLTVDGGSF